MLVTNPTPEYQQRLTELEAPIVEAARRLESVRDPECLRALLHSLPYTDEQLPRVGGNVPRSSRFFKSNYVRLLPVVGNALRYSIDEYERNRRYDATGLDPSRTMLFYERAKATVIANLDMLDLLRNSWLDALQELDAQLDDRDVALDQLDAAKDAVRAAARSYLEAAQITENNPPARSKLPESLPAVCSRTALESGA